MLKKNLLLLLLILILPHFSFGQSDTKLQYNNLAFEGGGIRGIAYGGVVLALEEKGVLQNIQRVGGTSAGAIISCLLAVGYKPEEIHDIIMETKINRFSDGRFIFIGGFNRLMRMYGWYRGDKFTNWIGNLIDAKTGNADITFGELQKRNDLKKLPLLYVTATNLSKQQAVVLSHETYPEMKVKDAVRISISIPFFFKAVVIDSAGRVINNKNKIIKGDILVDGGILMNYPVDMFDHSRYANLSSDTGYVYNTATLGIRVDREEQILSDERDMKLAPYAIQDLKTYISAFYTVIIETLNRKHASNEDFKRSVYINTSGFSPRIRRLSKNEKSFLINNGREAVNKFFH